MSNTLWPSNTGDPTATPIWHWRCHRCNLRKGPNLTGIDPYTGELVPLFHPRRDEWNAHFRWQGMQIEGVSPVGRATVQVLAMNDARRLELRTKWMMLGGPPDV